LHTRWGIPLERADLLSHISAGRPGLALRLHQQPEEFERRLAFLDDLVRLLSASRQQRFDFIESLSKKDKELVRDELLTWQSIWREVLMKTTSPDLPVSNLDFAGEIDALVAGSDMRKARQMVDAFANTLELISRNINARLALENLMLELPVRQ
jgi:hypothetical protein